MATWVRPRGASHCPKASRSPVVVPQVTSLLLQSPLRFQTSRTIPQSPCAHPNPHSICRSSPSRTLLSDPALETSVPIQSTVRALAKTRQPSRVRKDASAKRQGGRAAPLKLGFHPRRYQPLYVGSISISCFQGAVRGGMTNYRILQEINYSYRRLTHASRLIPEHPRSKQLPPGRR
jgi:hypothetical protein